MTSTPGRRAAARRPRRDPLVLVAVVVPLLTLLGSLLVHTDDTQSSGETTDRAPSETPLTRVDLLCPPAAGPPLAASLTDDGGSVTAAVPDDVDLDLAPATPTEVPDTSDDAVVLTGRDDVAPGLLGGRFTTPLAAAECRPPSFDQWFTGVGAGARHTSTLQLVNPDGSRALVDVEVLGRDGVVAAAKLHGVAVPAHSTVSLDLAAIVPRTDDLALHVRTLRGRVGASVADEFTRLGGRGSGVDVLPPQEEPRRTNLLLGAPAGDGRRVLVLANPGDDEGRATIKVVTESSSFAPEGLDEVVLPPHSVVRVTVGDAMSQADSDKDGERLVGLSVDSTVPATADLLQLLGNDLTHASSLEALDDAAASVLPDAASRLLLGGATESGVVRVETWDADGRSLPDQRVEVAAGSGSVADLPDGARLVRLTPSRTSISAVVLATAADKKDGTALVQVRVPQSTGLVPQVRPGLR